MIAIPHRRSVSLGRLALLALAVAGIGIAVTVLSRFTPGPAAPPLAPSAPAPFTVRATGRLEPVQWSRLSPAVAGQVGKVFVKEGELVAERQELVRIDSGDVSTLILAPYAATVASVPARLGETVLPGQVVAIVGDFTQFQIETTDLDEFSVAKVKVGQPVSLYFDAFEDLTLQGRVKSINLLGETGATGGVNFPVIIAVDLPRQDLRWGMTVRVHIVEGT